VIAAIGEVQCRPWWYDGPPTDGKTTVLSLLLRCPALLHNGFEGRCADSAFEAPDHAGNGLHT